MAIKSDSYLGSLFGLEGKTIVVTGAGGGIGLAISEGLLRAGAEVAMCNRTPAKCQPLADKINAEGGTASVHQLDVTSLDSIHACVDEVMARYGKIDVLFNVAGVNKREGLLDVEEADYDRIMNTNLKGLFFMSQAVAREMYKRRTGSIINIGSHNDEGMLGGCSVYGATKSGVVALTRAMPGICYARAWLNEGRLGVGDDLMLVLVGGDIRPHVVDALQFLVGGLKRECVREQELY